MVVQFLLSRRGVVNGNGSGSIARRSLAKKSVPNAIGNWFHHLGSERRPELYLCFCQLINGLWSYLAYCNVFGRFVYQ